MGAQGRGRTITRWAGSLSRPAHGASRPYSGVRAWQTAGDYVRINPPSRRSMNPRSLFESGGHSSRDKCPSAAVANEAAIGPKIGPCPPYGTIQSAESGIPRSEEHTSELQSHHDLVC